MPSVLWHCWLGGKKGIRPVKLSDEVLAWLSVWSKVQMISIWSSWCYCHPIISFFIKIQIGLTFCCQLTQTVLEKRPLNGCSSNSSQGKGSLISPSTVAFLLFWQCDTSVITILLCHLVDGRVTVPSWGQCLEFPSILLTGWQEGQLACKKTCAIYPKSPLL